MFFSIGSFLQYFIPLYLYLVAISGLQKGNRIVGQMVMIIGVELAFLNISSKLSGIVFSS